MADFYIGSKFFVCHGATGIALTYFACVCGLFVDTERKKNKVTFCYARQIDNDISRIEPFNSEVSN